MLFKKQKLPEPSRRSPIVTRRTDQVSSAPRGQVYSYRASRSQRQEVFGRIAPDKAERIKAWRERLLWLKSTPRLLALLVLLLVVGLLLRLDSRASVIPMDDAKGQVFLRSLPAYEEAVQRIFAGSFLNGNKLTVDAAQISADIKKQFPELKTVAISLPLTGSRPVVHVQPTVPALIMTTRSSGVFVIDTAGKAVITGNQVPDFSKLKVPVVVDESGINLNTGEIALPAKNVAFITEVVGQLKAKEVAISSLTLPAATSELQVRVEGQPYYVKFNLHGNAREEAGTFMAVKQKLEADRKIPAEYIDVRVPGKVYYK